jgi:hypothetical protein
MRTLTYRHLGRGGRLGNQIWELVSTLGIARDYGYKPVIPQWDYAPFFSFPRDIWGDPSDDSLEADSETFVPHMEHAARVYLQDYGLFSSIKDEVREWVKPPVDVLEGLDFDPDDLADVVSLHVRRGDNVTHPIGLHPLATVEYYAEAASRFTDKKIFVFSDDISWCRDVLPEALQRDDLFFVDGGVSRPHEHEQYDRAGPIDWRDLHIMAMCRGGSIIANSTYSWWAAFASGNENVFYPSAWFGYKLHKSEGGWIDPALMFPDNWTELHNPAVGAHKKD